MSSGKNSWTREVVCQAVIPIRIDPTASDEEAIEVVQKLIADSPSGALRVDQLDFFAIPLEDEEE
jgi:hypothetical protein